MGAKFIKFDVGSLIVIDNTKFGSDITVGYITEKLSRKPIDVRMLVDQFVLFFNKEEHYANQLGFNIKWDKSSAKSFYFGREISHYIRIGLWKLIANE
jgi:hypothetical protein